ncbi:hypothetical protein [Agromyces atrinae]|nr:hypothetical protein [Agromyces atrinae]
MNFDSPGGIVLIVLAVVSILGALTLTVMHLVRTFRDDDED